MSDNAHDETGLTMIAGRDGSSLSILTSPNLTSFRCSLSTSSFIAAYDLSWCRGLRVLSTDLIEFVQVLDKILNVARSKALIKPTDKPGMFC